MAAVLPTHVMLHVICTTLDDTLLSRKTKIESFLFTYERNLKTKPGDGVMPPNRISTRGVGCASVGCFSGFLASAVATSSWGEGVPSLELASSIGLGRCIFFSGWLSKHSTDWAGSGRLRTGVATGWLWPALESSINIFHSVLSCILQVHHESQHSFKNQDNFR